MTLPNGWVICWLCTCPEALTVRCENWMLRSAMLVPTRSAIIQSYLFAVPRVEVGDPVAIELSRRAIQAQARRLQVGQQVFPDHAIRRAGEFLDN
jgi:hypothetical protein